MIKLAGMQITIKNTTLIFFDQAIVLLNIYSIDIIMQA